MLLASISDAPTLLVWVIEGKCFVHSYCYLGCTLDEDLIVANEFKAVYRKAERKVYMLGKLRYFVEKKYCSFNIQAGCIALF